MWKGYDYKFMSQDGTIIILLSGYIRLEIENHPPWHLPFPCQIGKLTLVTPYKEFQTLDSCIALDGLQWFNQTPGLSRSYNYSHRGTWGQGGKQRGSAAGQASHPGPRPVTRRAIVSGATQPETKGYPLWFDRGSFWTPTVLTRSWCAQRNH